MPDPTRTYGAPMGAQQKTTGVQRNQAKPGDASDYMKAMVAADKAFHASKAKPTQGRSGATLGDTLAKGAPPVGIGGKQREATINRKVTEAGG